MKEISSHVEMFLVVGAQNSSNCNRLKDVAEAKGLPAFLINSVEELDMNFFHKTTRSPNGSVPAFYPDVFVLILRTAFLFLAAGEGFTGFG